MCRNFDRIVNEIRTEGILEGSELEKVNTIERLYLMNANIDVISCACGLDKETVMEIIHERQLQPTLVS